MKILNSLKAWGMGSGGGVARQKLQSLRFWPGVEQHEGMTAGTWHFLGVCALGEVWGEGLWTPVPGTAGMYCGPGAGLNNLPASYYFHLTLLLEKKN